MSKFTQGMSCLEKANYDAQEEIRSLRGDVGRQFIIIQSMKEAAVKRECYIKELQGKSTSGRFLILEPGEVVPHPDCVQQANDELTAKLKLANECIRILEGRLERIHRVCKGAL